MDSQVWWSRCSEGVRRCEGGMAETGGGRESVDE